MKIKDVMEIQRFFILSVTFYKSYSDTFISWCWEQGKLEFQKFFWIPLTNMIILRYNMPIPEVDLQQVGAHEIINAVLVRSGGSRISPRSGRQLSGGGAPTYHFSKFSQKLHEIETIWTPGDAPPLDPPLGRVHIFPPSIFKPTSSICDGL